MLKAESQVARLPYAGADPVWEDNNQTQQFVRGNIEQLYKMSQRDTLRRDVLAGIGRLAFHRIMLPIARKQLENEYEFMVKGRENIPDGAAVIAIPHQDHLDPQSFIAAIGEPVNTIAAIDGDATPAEWALLEMLDCISTIRGDHELARKRQIEAKLEEIQRLRNGRKVLVAPEITYGPEFNKLLRFYKGGVIDAPMEAGVPVVPSMVVYVPGEDYTTRAIHVEFGKPFMPGEYSDSFVAVNALERNMLGMKIRLNREHNPGMTPTDFARWRAAQSAKFPEDGDYYTTAKYTLNYKFDPKGTEALFRRPSAKEAQ